MISKCPLCKSDAKFFEKTENRLYYICTCCKGIFMDEKDRVNPEEEKKRYEQHNNDVEDERYQNFVSPITNSVLNDFGVKDKGLDFGAGTGPVISKILEDNGYQIKQYDPYFHNFPNLLKQQYNYIVSCEVIEHFYNPDKEFELLKSLLLSGGKLYCMTDIYNSSIDFKKWYYKEDETHVFIYQAETFEWIKEHYNFSDMHIDNRLIVFTK